MNKEFKNLKETFNKFGWSYAKMFLIGPRFMKDGNDIRITRTHCVINNVPYIYKEDNSTEKIISALSKICEQELVTCCIGYLHGYFY